MINLDGAGPVLATSFGYYTPFVVDLARKIGNVQFRHAAPFWNKDKDPKNAGGRSVNPKAAVQVIFAADWSMPVREAGRERCLSTPAATSSRVMSIGPKFVIETAEKRGVMSCGHNASQAPLAPKGFITGAGYKWIMIDKGYATDLAEGKTLPIFTACGYEVDFVQNTPFGAAATEPAKSSALADIEGLKAKRPIYVGPLKDNKTAKIVIDKTYNDLDPFPDKMEYLLDGVVSSTT